jgi:hypothetical protein
MKPWVQIFSTEKTMGIGGIFFWSELMKYNICTFLVMGYVDEYEISMPV